MYVGNLYGPYNNYVTYYMHYGLCYIQAKQGATLERVSLVRGIGAAAVL